MKDEVPYGDGLHRGNSGFSWLGFRGCGLREIRYSVLGFRA